MYMYKIRAIKGYSYCYFPQFQESMYFRKCHIYQNAFNAGVEPGFLERGLRYVKEGVRFSNFT